jgi:hypothetical protein
VSARPAFLLDRDGARPARPVLFVLLWSSSCIVKSFGCQRRTKVSEARTRKGRSGQRCRAEARDLLAPVYGWLTEGLATFDVTEAKALFDELG